MPHTLRRVDTGDDTLAELGVLIGFDDDLAGEATRVSNRIRGLLTGIHPALERVLGPRVTHPAVLEILSRCGSPGGIRAAGKRKLTASPPKTRSGWGKTGCGDLRRTRGSDGSSARVCGCRDCSTQTGGLAQRDTAATQHSWLGRREDARCPPSFLAPDLDARRRSQDCRTHPSRSR